MRAGVCFDGVESAELVKAATPFLGAFERVEAWCAYGDVAGRELAYVLRRHGRPAPRQEREACRAMLDEEQADAIAERGAALLREAGFPAAPRAVTGGDAGHALVEAAGARVALIVGAGHLPGAGPKSIGHVARFVIDHARAPVIVVRLSAENGS